MKTDCDIDELMETIRDLSKASERYGGYSWGKRNAQLGVVRFQALQEEAFNSINEAWAKIESMTGGKRP